MISEQPRALIMAGELVQVGASGELLAKPRNEFVARMLGYENVYRASIAKSTKDYSILDVEGMKLRVSSKVESIEMVALRSEDINVELSHSNEPAINVLKANIQEYDDLGALIMIKADAGLLLNVTMSKNSFIEKGLEIGKEVWLNFRNNAVKIIE